MNFNIRDKTKDHFDAMKFKLYDYKWNETKFV